MRVSKPWKESMARYGFISSGAVFLVGPCYYGRSSRLLTSELLGESVWSRLFQLRPNTIKHFVFVGQPMPFNEGRPFGKLFRLPHALRHVTFHSITINSSQLYALALCVLIEIDSVQFVKSTVQVEIIRLHVTPTFR
ncbi:hypothetical protein RvY_08784 [Ramazzottius varieornatus]|uniref:Uncharacterized protein n=1 Tax=Ramazzottius varieornatus TaxID=947166 RepID=A0A1D1VBQ6_RAMVA|nr:hypothetical protein RvY_08784 [Ramazzottius varieornatus]